MRTAIALLLAGACTAETPAPPPRAAAVVAVAVEAPALDLQRIAALQTRFEGGKRCDVEALAELRAMKSTSPPPELEGALVTAYTACDEPGAIADLLRETLPVEATVEQELAIGIALVRAARYQEAAQWLEPIAHRELPQSKAAWLYGFALFHGGESERALPVLMAARSHGSAADAAVMIGLAKLHVGDSVGAIAELEAGIAAAPDNVSLIAALGRAYTEVGRTDDADRLAQRSRETGDALAHDERRKLQLSGLGTQLTDARKHGRDDEALRIVATMLELDPPEPVRKQLAEVQAELTQRRGTTP